MLPGSADILAAIQRPQLALKVGSGGHPNRLGVSRHFPDAPTISVPLFVEPTLQVDVGPMVPMVLAAEQPGPRDAEDCPRYQGTSHNAVHIDQVVVHVQTVA